MGVFNQRFYCRLVTILIIPVMMGATSSFAQQKHPFDLPKELPVPMWVQQTDWAHPNVHKIEARIAAWKSANKAEAHEADGEDEFNEEPYMNAYIRWRNEMDAFIQTDGSIQYDADYERRQLLQSLADQKAATPENTAQKTTAAANWTLLGPVETYQTGTGALRNYQNNIYCIAVAPSNPSVLYAGSEPSTFYRSADKGLHWVSVSESLPTCGSKSIAVDPWNENIVYTYNGSANTLMKTATGGASWAALTTYTGTGGNAIAINKNTGRVLITGNTAIYYSDDAGATWTAAGGSSLTGTYYDLVLNPTGTDTVYAAGSTAANALVLMRSVNGGTSFSDVTGAVAGTTTSGARLGVSAANSNFVYCINLGSAVPPTVIKTTDRGATWSITATSTTTGLTGSSATTGLGMSNGQGYYDLSLVVSPLNANHVIVGSTTTYKSTDGGVNFSPVGGYSGPIGIHPDIQQAIAIGGDTYIATDGGVNYSSDFFTNVANWSVRNNGLRSSEFWGFGQGWDEDIVVGGRYHNGNTAIYDVYGGGKALSLGGGEDATGHVYHGYAGTAGFRDIGNLILPTSLAGPVMYNAPNVPNSLWPQDDYYGQFSSKLVIDPRYSNVFYLGKDSTLWKSSNRGISYNALHDFGSKVWRFDVARHNPDVIYVCANSGLYKTVDAGATWSSLTLPTTWQYYNSDITTNPLNENEVYLCMRDGSAANKVFKSTDGGASWTNMTGSALNAQKVAFLQYHGGTNGGIYAITNSKPSKVYYRDNTMTDWIDFSAGLPASLVAREGGLLFYRDSKMRLAGNCSIWESPLYGTGAPVAQPMADRKHVGCARDTVNFYDYSMYNYAGASRLWAFPGALWVSSYTALRPQVVYPGPGSYSVSLSVTNSSAATDTRTIADMIVVSDDHCGPDTVAGTCLQLNGTSQTVNLGTANIHSNTFSISCWIQPEGNQKSFSQIIGHDRYPGSAGYGFGFGFKFAGYTPNLNLCYTDSTVGYSNSSSLICDSTRWNFVVLTYSPSGVVLYLNGIADTVNNGPMPIIDLSQSPFQSNLDVHSGQGSKYKGKIEEVKFYNYTLSQAEVREKMHLITDPFSETGLIKYFQFNQYDLLSNSLYDVKNNFNALVPTANIVASTAPVGSGRVFRNPSVNSAGLNSFAPAGVNLHLPSASTYPDGEVVAFHLFTNPDTRPDTRATVPGYFILNNYGTNATFTQPDSVVLSGLNISLPAYTPGSFKLFERATGDFGNTWSAELDSAATYMYAPGSSSLTWTAGSGITALNSQFVIVNSNEASGAPIISPVTSSLTMSELYPNPTREWTKVAIYMPVSLQKDVTFTVTDIRGATIMRFSEMLKKGNNTVLFPLRHMSAGNYIVSIEVPGEMTQSRKLTVE